MSTMIVSKAQKQRNNGNKAVQKINNLDFKPNQHSKNDNKFQFN